MKYVSLILFGLMMAIYIPLSAQTKETVKNQNQADVPEHVTTKFSHDYPQTADTKWVMEGDAFVVEFSTAGGGNQKAWYDQSGEKQKEAQELNPKTDLPSPVKEALRSHYGSYKIKNISQESARGITSYRITLDENGVQKEVVVNGDGKIDETEFK